MKGDPLPITIADVRAAADRIRGHAVRTPLLFSPVLNEATRARVFVKAECLQRTGSFKFRGAFNRLAAMDPTERARGVVATSSGNHAQGVAEAARLFAVPATIVMPSDAPANKKERTERSGATVVEYDRHSADRMAIADEIADRTGAVFVPPYDDPFVMAGQGTAGLEAAADLAAFGERPDMVLICTGGGGLLAGVATAMHDAFPGVACHPVEPEGFDDTTRSLVSGERETNVALAGSIADAILTPTPGAITIKVNRRLATPGYAVPDDALLPAMRFAAEELRIITEPGGVIALAAALTGIAPVAGRTVLCIVSGGNADAALVARALSS